MASTLWATCAGDEVPSTRPSEPRPTRTVTILYSQLLPQDDLAPGGGPEVTTTADSDLALVLEEPDPMRVRWVLLYTPPFLSAKVATFLPQGDASDSTPRSVFVFSPLQSGRDEVEFGRIPITGTAAPTTRTAVTVGTR